MECRQNAIGLRRFLRYSRRAEPTLLGSERNDRVRSVPRIPRRRAAAGHPGLGSKATSRRPQHAAATPPQATPTGRRPSASTRPCDFHRPGSTPAGPPATNPPHPAAPPAATAPPPAPHPPQPVDVTMRLPVQAPHPASVTTPPMHPPAAAGERLIGKYRVKGEARAWRDGRGLPGGAAGPGPRGRDQRAHPVAGRRPDRADAVPAGSAGHGADQPPQPGPGSRPRTDRRRQLHRPGVRPRPVATRPVEPGTHPDAPDLRRDARRPAGARLRAQALDRPPRHEAGERPAFG